jgi:raffinose/stachyose/melibiose transport system permease protein
MDSFMRLSPFRPPAGRGRDATQFSLLAAASIIVALPVVVLSMFPQRHVISSMLSGAVKE